MGPHVTCCLLFIGLLSLVKSAPSVRAEPGVYKDDKVILGDIDIAHNSIYKLACKVPEATMEHKLTMEVRINGRLRLSPSPSVSLYLDSTSLYSSSLHREYFLYTTQELQVTCTARYRDGTVKTTLRATPASTGADKTGAKADKHHPNFVSMRCRQYRRAVRNRRVEPWAAGLRDTPGNLTDKDLLQQISRTRNQAAWKIMKLTKRHYCLDDGETQVGDNVQPAVEGSPDHSHTASRASGPLGAQEQEYIKKSREVYEKLWEMYQTTDAWELESGSSHATPEQGCVHTRDFTGIGKVYRLQGYVDGSPELLFNELVARVTDTPKWSSTVLKCRVIQYLDNTTNILYTVAAEAAGGFVSSRDFVNLNHYAPKDGVMVSSAIAITHPQMPVSEDHVRGESGPGGYIFKPVPGHPNKCLLIQMINTDLKGWIPQYIVDQALSGVLIQYHKDVQTHIAEVQKSSKQDQ